MPLSSEVMYPGAFTPPPTVRNAYPSARRRPSPNKRARAADALLVASAVTLAGVTGFLALLIAGSLVPGAATVLRVLALVWFAVFGVWYVRVSARIP